MTEIFLALLLSFHGNGQERMMNWEVLLMCCPVCLNLMQEFGLKNINLAYF